MSDKRENYLSWDEYFMMNALLISARSKDPHNRVGSCIVNSDNKVLSVGYNGAPNGIKHCSERGGCLRELRKIPSGTMQEVCMAIHAEQNAMIRASKRDMEGAILYVNTYPCAICTRMIINARISRIVYKSDYKDEVSKEMLQESGIEVIKID